MAYWIDRLEAFALTSIASAAWRTAALASALVALWVAGVWVTI